MLKPAFLIEVVNFNDLLQCYYKNLTVSSQKNSSVRFACSQSSPLLQTKFANVTYLWGRKLAAQSDIVNVLH